MDIREIQTADLPKLAQLYTMVFNQAPWNEPWTEHTAHDRLAHFYHSRGFVGLLAELDQQPVAMLMGAKEPYHTGQIFYLREICVNAEYRNKGIGSDLMTRLCSILKSQGVAGQFLATDKTIPAAAFYKKIGFKENADIHFYFHKLSEN